VNAASSSILEGEQTMKNITKIIVATASVASLAAVSIVSAHPGGGYGMGFGQGMGPGIGMMGPGHGMGPGTGMGPGFGMGGMHGFDSPGVTAARLGDLKATLKITPAQEPAWATYEAQVRQQVETRQTFHAAMWAQMQDPKATIDHSAQHEAMGRLMAAQTEARNALYAVLTPEQKAVFDRPQGRGYGPHMGW
jgi:Spy/CpxP family protein refolding chaperone